jgi:hypothetical protein
LRATSPGSALEKSMKAARRSCISPTTPFGGTLPLSLRWRPVCVRKPQRPGKPGTVCSRPAADIFCPPDTSGWCTRMRPRADLSTPPGVPALRCANRP